MVTNCDFILRFIVSNAECTPMKATFKGEILKTTELFITTSGQNLCIPLKLPHTYVYMYATFLTEVHM